LAQPAIANTPSMTAANPTLRNEVITFIPVPPMFRSRRTWLVPEGAI
jgi:hypothetical protein